MTDKPATGKEPIGEAEPTENVSQKPLSADWLMRGILTRIGDSLDQFTGRKWTPSSSIATSELVERLKSLLAAEAKEIPGKGTVVPHNIKLKMQWDKFSTDSDETLERVQNELMVAAADFINDNLYYTLAPLHLEIKSDYFTEGVKLYASFGEFREDQDDVELNVTMPSMTLEAAGISLQEPPATTFQLIASFTAEGRSVEKKLTVTPGKHISIGRLGGNRLIINDPSISKTHASLVVDADGYMTIADTASTNGTFVNDERIAYGKSVPIKASDKLKVGTVEVSLDLSKQTGPIDDEPGEELTVPAEGPQLLVRTNPVETENAEGPEQMAVDEAPGPEGDNKEAKDERETENATEIKAGPDADATIATKEASPSSD